MRLAKYSIRNERSVSIAHADLFRSQDFRVTCHSSYRISRNGFNYPGTGSCSNEKSTVRTKGLREKRKGNYYRIYQRLSIRPTTPALPPPQTYPLPPQPLACPRPSSVTSEVSKNEQALSFAQDHSRLS